MSNKELVLGRIALLTDMYVYKTRSGYIAELRNKKEVVLVAGGETDKLAIDNLFAKIKEYYKE